MELIKQGHNSKRILTGLKDESNENVKVLSKNFEDNVYKVKEYEIAMKEELQAKNDKLSNDYDEYKNKSCKKYSYR